MAIEAITKRPRGVSLIELVLTLTLMSVISISLVGMIAGPLEGYFALGQRAELVSIADNSLRLISRDIRSSVPNSVRVATNGQIKVIEMLPIISAAQYRTTPPGTSNEILDFSSTNSQFTILGNFDSETISGSGASSPYRLVIYNTGEYTGTPDSPNAGVNVYNSSTSPGPFPMAGTHVISPLATKITLQNNGNEDRVILSSPFQFALNGPQNRVYIASFPLTYLCNEATGELYRYTGYALSATQPKTNNALPLSVLSGDNAALVANSVSSCQFLYQAGTSERGGIVTLNVTLTNGNNESINLLKQVHVNNAA